MATVQAIDAVDTRRGLWVYGVVMGAGGALVAASAPLVGAALIAAALVAFGLGTLDAYDCRRMLSWFIAAHVVAWATLQVLSLTALHDRELARQMSWLLLMAIVGLLYTRFPEPWTERQLVSLARREGGRSERTRGLHEQQIRDAAAQEERNRIARDLHDAVKQQIFAMQTSAATAEARFDTDPAGARAALGHVRQSAREAMAEMEALLEQLRVAPIGNAGLVEAIRKQTEALAFRTGARVDLHVGPLPDEDALGPGTHQAIFRIVQEALANVGRHARAQSVRVAIEATPALLDVTVQDDGRGFDTSAPSGGMGLRGMRARASEIGGTLEVTTAHDAGTRVLLSVPYESVDARRSRQRQALGLVMVLSVATVLLLVDLVQKGPGMGSVSLIVFVLLLLRHLRVWLRLRTTREPATAEHTS